MAVADFDGTGDYIDCEPVDLTGALTIAAVFKREANGAWHTLASGQTSADSFRWSLSLTDTDRLAGGTNTGAVAKSHNSGAGGTGTTFTIQVADGYVIGVWSKPSGNSGGTLSVFKAGAWSHYTYSNTDFNNAGSIGAGKVRIGRFEAASDDANLRHAALAVWAGTALNQTQVESLDGGDAVAWQSVGGGYTELVEPGMDGSSARANWTAPLPSINGTMDGTAFIGNGTIVTGDDPASTIYTVGAGGTPWPPPDNPAAPPLRVARSTLRLG